MVDLRPLLYWVKERESIRIKKERGDPWPWTDDPILRQYSFCNVTRESDRVTRWIKENIRDPYADHPDLFWMLCAARQLNWPDTLAELIALGAWPSYKVFTPKQATVVLESRARAGLKVFTGAYLIRAESSKHVFWFSWTKHRYIAEIVLGGVWERREEFNNLIDNNSTMQQVHERLMTVRGFGPFMAYQTIVDCRFTRLLCNASDITYWAAAGPGTIKGLNYIHGRPPKTGISQEQALYEIRSIEPEIRRNVNCDFDFSDIPNMLCETSKWIKVKNGEGRIRSLYRVRD